MEVWSMADHVGAIKRPALHDRKYPESDPVHIIQACLSTNGYITNDYKSKISFISTRLPIDTNVSSLLKEATIRSLSCEVVPEKEGQVYFGDSARGHILSYTFFLKDAQARGFHRWYSLLVFMKDKHLLLNSWPFFEKHLSQLIVYLQKKAEHVYTIEQTVCSQRKLRLSNIDQKHSSVPIRSLVKLTGCSAVFAHLHVWFTWLLSAGAKRLEENTANNMLQRCSNKTCQVEINSAGNDQNVVHSIWHLRKLRFILGTDNFHKLIYFTLIGRQIIVRGSKIVVCVIVNLLKLFLPPHKFRCIEYGETYKSPDICNILGLNMYAAVPKSSENLLRLDVIPNHELGTRNFNAFDEVYDFYNFIIKNEGKLPEKLPSLLVKFDKALSDNSITDRVVWLHFTSLMEQWLHTAHVIKEAKRIRRNENYCSRLMKFLQVQDQDELIINFWTS